MKGVYVGQKPLNVLSCAVEGRPGRSAYDLAVAGGYTGTQEAYETFLGALPDSLSELDANKSRVNAILETLENQIADLQLAMTALTARVTALEAET
ncbi:MAG: hypothetical protein IIY70_02825 [Oscillospiraceae bacterium]|nr:hypothetical protein [Oscillospiraceae bacterium]